MASEEITQFPKEIMELLLDGYDVTLKKDVKDGIVMAKVMAQKPRVWKRYVMGAEKDLKNMR